MLLFFEINQKLESQPLQVQQAGRWADQAYREKISKCGDLGTGQ